jgi:hypothetical protein
MSPFSGFPTYLISKTLYLEGSLTATSIMLTKVGRADNLSVEVAISTSSDETTWNDWQYLTLGEITTVTSPAKYLRVQVSGDESTVLYSKDARGVNIGVEIDVLEVA